MLLEVDLHTEFEFDVIVIGAGAMGSAAAYHLSQVAGQRVLLLEQFAFGHALGSSHGESRIFRYAYTDPAYARLAMQCKPLWQALGAEAGVEVLQTIGGIDLGDDEVGIRSVAEVAATLESVGAPYEALDAAQLRDRFPQWHVPPQTQALYSPDTSFVWAGRAVGAMIAQAARHGADVHDQEPVVRVDAHADGVEVVTARQTYRARKLIMAAGAWTNSLLATVDGASATLPLKIEKEQLHYVAPLRPEWFAPEGPHRFPIWIQYGANTAYGFPILGSDGYPRGIKCGFHHDRHFIDVGDTDRTPSAEVEARMMDYLRTYLPDAAGDVVGRVCCLYTNTPDENFIIDQVPGHPHIWLASPCSGHGFKFAIGIGKALADLATRGETAMAVDGFSMARLL